MITPRRTRLVRVPDLQTFRRAIIRLSLTGDAEERRTRAVLVPTAGAARQLERSIADPAAPYIGTREELYDRLYACLEAPPARLTTYERDVIMQSAAREASRGEAHRVRPGHVAEILRFYDQLRRQGRNIVRFEELLSDALSREADHDRGAERMLAQAQWLSAAFRGYEDRVRKGGACDEHVLRTLLIEQPLTNSLRGIVITVGDWIADPNGLFLADYDLLTRISGVETIDVVATAAVLASGFHQRLHEWLPEIEEVDVRELEGSGHCSSRPTLCVPAADGDRLVFVHRDREEELIAVADGVKARGAAQASLDRMGVVVKRPLPYLYLAREVFRSAGLPYQTFDALPLAAEPFAAALDLVLDFVESAFTRRSLVALLRSPHFGFRHDGRRIDRHAIADLDRALSEMRYLGGFERLMEIELDAIQRGFGEAAAFALEAARAAASMLSPLLGDAPASSQLRLLTVFLDTYETELPGNDPESARRRRSRQAIRDVLGDLAAAHKTHDDVIADVRGITAYIRRWIEEHTSVPEPSAGGIQLLDDQAARYVDFDELTLVGLIEGEWPERPKRNIFYPAWLLVSLGWPTEKDRRAAAEARFLDLLGSPTGRVTVSTVSLDDDALVEPSAFVDEIERADLERKSSRLFADVESANPPDPVSDPDAREWLAIRLAARPPDSPEFHGFVEPFARPANSPASISALETYLACPFKFFAQYVLRLEEEPEDEEVMDPRTQGQFVHEVFETFFKQWQREGRGTISVETIGTARSVFRGVVEELVETWELSDTEASVERTRLLGSAAAAGLGEAVFQMEMDRQTSVVDRLLEHTLSGDFTLETSNGPRRFALRGKADRLDLLEDGTFRVIDYKLGWPPDKGRALQLPIYGICAEQSLGASGRPWTMGEAAYIAFKGPRRVVRLFRSADERARVLNDAQQRVADTLDAIAAGRFPPAPDDVFRCETCAAAAVCRKEYVGDV